MKPPPTLRARALAILARHETSRAELARKLAPHAQSEEELENLLQELAGRHWQSDRRFAETYVNSKGRLHGNLRLKQALRAKGIDEETARLCLPDRDSELQTAVGVLRKKFKTPAADLKEKQKQARFLAYRGFDADVVQAAMKTFNGGGD